MNVDEAIKYVLWIALFIILLFAVKYLLGRMGII